MRSSSCRGGAAGVGAVVGAGCEGARVEEADAVDAVVVRALDRADEAPRQRVEQQHALVLARRGQDGPEIEINSCEGACKTFRSHETALPRLIYQQIKTMMTGVLQHTA